jgi:hypothetical protein
MGVADPNAEATWRTVERVTSASEVSDLVHDEGWPCIDRIARYVDGLVEWEKSGPRPATPTAAPARRRPPNSDQVAP